LWREDRARDVMSVLMPYVGLCIGNEEDPARIFGMKPRGSDADRGRLDLEGFQALAFKLQKKFGFSKVALTLRESLSASENMWSACLLSEGEFHHSTRYRVWIVDRVGSGDAFAAGLIHALLEGRPDRDALEFGVAAAVLKHSLKGDFNLVSAAEVDRAAAGGTAGRIQR
jgi:2-dehydro-3-deoxygluconokinase